MRRERERERAGAHARERGRVASAARLEKTTFGSRRRWPHAKVCSNCSSDSDSCRDSTQYLCAHMCVIRVCVCVCVCGYTCSYLCVQHAMCAYVNKPTRATLVSTFSAFFWIQTRIGALFLFESLFLFKASSLSSSSLSLCLSLFRSCSC